MTVTQEEAKAKWCPFSRSWTEQGSANRDHNGDLRGADKCLASGCMAWRGGPVINRVYWKDGEQFVEPQTPDKGYCGLAGAVHHA